MNFDLLFKEAKARGIEELQIYLASNSEFELEVLKGDLEKYIISSTQKLSVKGIYDSKMGTVETEVINDDTIDFILDSVIASAKAINSEDEVFIYEGDKEYKKVEGLYNPELDKVEAKKKIDAMFELEKKTMAKDERIRMVQAFYGDGTVNVLIQNSKGLKLEKHVNNGLMGVYIVASDGTDQRTAFEYIQSNDYAQSALIKMPTGTGKTGIIAIISKYYFKKSVLIVVPWKHLKSQMRYHLAEKFWVNIKLKKEKILLDDILSGKFNE